MKKGLFISFEGIGASGKTTLINCLYNYFIKKGRNVVSTSDLRGTEFAENCRAMLMAQKKRGTASPLELQRIAMHGRADVLEKVIIPALNNDNIVLCDRYIDSGLAYQGYGAQSKEVIDAYPKLCTSFLNDVKPNLTFLLKIDAELAVKRLQQRGNRDVFENTIADLERVQNGFLEIAKQNPQRIKIINGGRPSDVTFACMVKILKCERVI